MLGFAAPPLAKVRVAVAAGPFSGVTGILASFPGVEIAALCAETEEELKRARQFVERQKLPPPKKEYVGADACKRMVDDRVADVFYNGLLCLNNTDLNVYAMNGKMHVVSDPPVRCTVDDCWKLVEASEKNKVHCVSGSRNSIYYGEWPLFALNLTRQGLLGDLVACEGAFFLDRRMGLQGKDPRDRSVWKVRMASKGLSRPWYTLAPISRCLDINRGDRLDTLVSLSSGNSSLRGFVEGCKDVSLSNRLAADGCDVNATFLRTAKGRIVTLRQSMTLPSPWHMPFSIYGTKGVLQWNGNNVKMGGESISSRYKVQFMDEKAMGEMREKFKHPLWKKAGEIARKLGGHGGGPSLEEMYRIYCLRYGLPMGTDVYDFATLASLMKLTDKSARANGKSIEVPDFTRGAWKSAAPRPIEDVDVEKFFSV